MFVCFFLGTKTSFKISIRYNATPEQNLSHFFWWTMFFFHSHIPNIILQARCLNFNKIESNYIIRNCWFKAKNFGNTLTLWINDSFSNGFIHFISCQLTYKSIRTFYIRFCCCTINIIPWHFDYKFIANLLEIFRSI